jgi:1-acyl-sn-glycerol-3-phosphate acyltransferase
MTAESTDTSSRWNKLAFGPVRLVYALYAALLFLVIGVGATLLGLLLPGVHRRRAVARAAARSFLFLAGMPIRLTSAELLPEGQCVVVANHASYLDGVVFTAALPARFAFVIKREMANVPLAGFMLRRLGSEFVERFNRHRSASDARRVVRKAVDGHSLVFFPEGTFSREPGLLRFHTGAFVTAVHAGCPVVPAVVRGTRAALSPRGELPRPGWIEIRLLPPLTPASSRADAVPELRDRARQVILSELGEPDLTCSADTVPPPHTVHARSVPASRP